MNKNSHNFTFGKFDRKNINDVRLIDNAIS